MQSTDPTAALSQASNDGIQEIVVTAQAEAPVLAQRFLPPVLGLGDDLDPVAQALKEGREPTEAEKIAYEKWFNKGRTGTPQVGTPPQFPIDPPSPPNIFQRFWNWLTDKFLTAPTTSVCTPQAPCNA